MQAAREAARRSQCVNNIKQFGLAMANYHETKDCFPPGGLNMTRGTTNALAGTDYSSWSCFAYMLPQMEQSALYNAANFMMGTGQGDATGSVRQFDGDQDSVQDHALPFGFSATVWSRHQWAYGIDSGPRR